MGWLKDCFRYTVQCALLINIINEKVFAFFWWVLWTLSEEGCKSPSVKFLQLSIKIVGAGISFLLLLQRKYRPTSNSLFNVPGAQLFSGSQTVFSCQKRSTMFSNTCRLPSQTIEKEEPNCFLFPNLELPVIEIP